MKRIIRVIIAGIFFMLVNTSFACEICGCGNNNFQIGILPNFNKGFFGIRYSTSNYHSRLSSDATQYSHDFYKVTELWGGYNFKKFQVMAFIPYLFNKKISDDGTVTSNGLGDLLILTNYKILSSSTLTKSETTTFRNDLFVGGGIKLPTGSNNVDVINPDFNIGDFNSQPGTGSVDFIISLTHNLMWNKSGVVTNAAYRINTNNPQDYKFGNRTYISAVYYYTLTANEWKIKPSAGISYQSNTVNTFAGASVEGSNGYNLSSTAGLNFLYKKIGINAVAFLPIKQEMYQGQTSLALRTTVGVTYSF